jgi:hypothetical protein
MTPAALSQALTETEEDIKPDWVDKDTQAEIAAQVASEMADEVCYLNG